MTHREKVMVLRIAKNFLYISTVKRDGAKESRLSNETKNTWVRSTKIKGMPVGSRVLPIDLIRLA